MDYKDDLYYIEQVLKGHPGAFEYIVSRHKDNVFNLAIRICGNREDAEEVAQDSFLKVFRSLGNFKMRCAFSTWLYRIVYNTSVSKVRLRKEPLLSLEDFPAEASDFNAFVTGPDEAENEYRKALVNFAMAKLKDEERAIITLYYYEEMSIEDISVVTQQNCNNIKVKLFRARKKMLEVIEKAEEKNTFCYEKSKQI